MLKNLIKYELRSTARIFLFSYLAMVAITVAGIVIRAIANTAGRNPVEHTVLSFAVLALVIAVIVVCVITLIVIILRFGRNLLGDEGYLLFTLPTTTDKLILSKLISGIIWCVAGCAVTVLCILLIGTVTGTNLDSLMNTLAAATGAGMNVGGYIAWFIAMAVISLASLILGLYCSMALGQHITKNRVTGSCIAFIIICIATQIITYSVLALMHITQRAEYGAKQVEAVMNAGSESAQLKVWVDFANGVFNSYSIAVTVMSAALGIACYAITRYLLKRKLNLA
ncbi:MAG: hypothetical protein LBG82_03015 [Clostridiales Family XIII bacterium]|jgi:hypothetical protein|nr:hypothetical protein [Clostridiales Family XIII bacterium]